MNTYLHKFIEALELTHGDQIYAVQDMEFKHIWCSDKYLELIGVESMVGLRFRDLTHPLHKKLQQALSPTTKYLNRYGGSLQWITSLINPKTNKSVIVLTNCCEIKDPKSNQAIARMARLDILTPLLLNQMHSVIKGISSDEIVDNLPESSLIYENEIVLSDMEQGILFLLLIGKSYKDIANILRNSDKQINESVIKHKVHDKLLKKFEVSSVKHLILKISQFNYLKNIPSCILRLVNEENIKLLNLYGEEAHKKQ